MEPLTPIFCLLFLVMGIVALLACVRYGMRRRERKIDAAFAGRSMLQANEFYEQYFYEQDVPKEIVLAIRNILEKHLDADLSRLVASDDFSKNLAFFFEYDSMADVEIVLALEEAFSIGISNEEAANAHTVQDIVNLVWRKVDARIKTN